VKEVQDHFFKLAKEEGYRARSAYKLTEIDDRFRVLRAGARVLDLGACPGSWTQVAARRVGERGIVVGIDLKPIDRRGLGRHVHVMQGDIHALVREDLPPEMEGRLFDSVISDMGPDTSGVPMADSARSVQLCHAMLDRLPFLLRTGGHAVMKVYEGAEYPAMLRRAQAMFDEARGFKPKASRAESVEMFVVCRGYRGPAKEAAVERDPMLPKRPPSSGWAPAGPRTDLGTRARPRSRHARAGSWAVSTASRRPASSTFSRELNALIRKNPSPQRPKPAPGVTTSCSRVSRRSKASQLPRPRGHCTHTYGAWSPPQVRRPRSTQA
jgi:23S rRNA (uridine2552-2'-O)-methyltransferase